MCSTFNNVLQTIIKWFIISVESFDSIACKQLDRLETVVPVLKKEPEEVKILSFLMT